jgi:DNA mismatch repair protein MutS
MYEEYLTLFKEHEARYGKKVAVFFMVGIFYEMYDVYDPSTGRGLTTVSELVDLLGLKVSVKKGEGPGGLDGHVAGIPDYTLNKWAGKLTSEGWTVVVVEQVKGANGKVIRREVRRILTPGTHIEVAGSGDHYITFVTLSQHSVTLVALDLTTGHLHTFDTSMDQSSHILQFMHIYMPKEVLWAYHGPQASSPYSESQLKQALGCPAHVTFHQRNPLNSGAWTNAAFREDYLRQKCSLKSLLPTHVALYIKPGWNTETALLSLLNALEEFWPSMSLGALLVFPWIPGSMMRLGENALMQLHMPDVLQLLDTPATAMGRRGLRERLLKPSADPRKIMANLDAVEVWTLADAQRDETVKRMRTISDLDRLYRKLQQGSFNAADIVGLDISLKALAWLGASESDLCHVRSKVFAVLDLDKALGASEDTSLFRKGHLELDVLEAKIQEVHRKVQEWIGQRAASISISPDTLRPEYRDKTLIIRGPRAAIQNLKNSGKLPLNTTAVVNKSNSYLESHEIDSFYGTLCRLRSDLRSMSLVAHVEQGTILANSILVEWMRLTDWITYTDANLTLARSALRLGYTKPQIIDGDEGFLSVEGLRHPILESQDRTITYVQHSVHLDSELPGWLLYGLNASGKSSLMKATGIALLLAQGGSFVPASKMCISPFESLHTRIVNTDNIWMGLSSFAVEMSEMREIFRDAGSKSLVLGDELCSGTETTSATALVAAGLLGLLRRGAKFFFATHLHGLTKIPEVAQATGLRIWHLHVEYDPVSEKLIYHRVLREGSGSSLYGLEVAKAMKLPADILENAQMFRKRLVGESVLSEATGSAWNSSVIRTLCELCGNSFVKSLEVHHVKERSEANAHGRLPDGSNVHARANLLTLCDACHDGVHKDPVIIGPVVQTSEGCERSVSVKTESSRSKWSEEELATIKNVFVKFPSLSDSNVSKYLLNSEYNIKISAATLKKMR